MKPSVGHSHTPPGMSATIESAHGVGARLYLDRQAQELHRRFEVGVHSAVLDGPVPSAIVEHVHYDPPDLIVMSTHGRSGPARLFSGSVADRLLRELHCPFILVRPGSALAAGQLSAQPRVLVALDGSSLAESVVDEVSRFFPCEVTTLHLLRVIAPGRGLPGRRTHRRGVSGEHGIEAPPAGVGGRARSRHRLASVGRGVALGRGAPVRPGRDGDAGAWRGAADVPGQRGRQSHPVRGYAGPRGEPLGGRLQPRPGGATRGRNGGAAVRGRRLAQYCSSMNL